MTGEKRGVDKGNNVKQAEGRPELPFTRQQLSGTGEGIESGPESGCDAHQPLLVNYLDCFRAAIHPAAT